MIKISVINYDGVISRKEFDEYIEIVNDGQEAVDLSGWVVDAGPGSATNAQKFTFADGTVFQPGDRKRIYTNLAKAIEAAATNPKIAPIDPDNSFSFNVNTAIWGNKGGTGTLRNANGQEIDSYTYPLQTPDPWVFSTLSPGGEGEHDFGSQRLGTNKKTAIFTLENRRSDRDLELTGDIIVSSGSPAFVVETQPDSPIPPLGTAEFKVSFDANATGEIDGELSIPVEDLAQPFMVKLTGKGVAKPKIDLLHGDDHIASGEACNVGRVNVDSSARTTFTIENDGGSPLQITDITLSNSTDFALDGLPAMSKILAPNESFDFNVNFKPKSGNAKQTKVTIISGELAPYEVTLNGWGIEAKPDIEISCDGVNVADHGSINMGRVTIGAAATSKKVTIKNSGDGPLKISKISLSGSSGSFWAGALPSNKSLAKGETLDFTVNFRPRSTAVSPAQVTIFSDDPDEGRYTFSLTGRGIQPIPPKKPGHLVVKQYYSYTRIYDIRMTNGGQANFDLQERLHSYSNYACLCYYVENDGEQDLTIQNVTLSNNHSFKFTSDVGTPNGRAPRFPHVIRPGGRMILFLIYLRNRSSNSTAITFQTNDPTQSTFRFNVNILGDNNSDGHGGYGGNHGYGGGYGGSGYGSHGGGYGGGYGGSGGHGSWKVHSNYHGSGRGMQISNGGMARVPSSGTTYIEVSPPGGSWQGYNENGLSLVIDGGVFGVIHKTTVGGYPSQPIIFSINCYRPNMNANARLVYNGSTVHQFQIMGQYGL